MFLSHKEYFILFILCQCLVWGSVRFTNVKCIVYDPEYVRAEICYLKLIQRGIVGMNVYIRLYDIPVTNVTVNLSLHKKANGYRPFLYNMTVDFCKFMKSRSSFPLLKIFFDAMSRDSNLNHTCPYDHDIIVHNWILKESDFRLLPLPEGYYVFKCKFSAYNVRRIDVEGYFSIN